MRENTQVLRRLMLAAALLALPPTLAQAARPEVATAGSGGDAVVWQPQIAGYDRLVLTVAGPGLNVTREFAQGEAPTFPLFDAAGNHLADGVYKWELRVVPQIDAATRRAMQAEREAGTSRVAEGLRASGALPPVSYQSGAFSVVGGAAVLPGDVAEEAGGGVRSIAAPVSSLPSQVVLTNADGVIRNSLCVGFDCPDNPAFGDSTILMMENNTRIKFGDTSAAGFPANDWEIEANSAAAGGLSYLGFNDCGAADDDGGCATDLLFAVEAGARQNALYVEGDGDVGLGTSNPVLDLHVVTGNTPAIRLEQDGSSGFTAQTWDIAGNEASFFVRDVTGGSTLPFRIQPGAASNSLTIGSDDQVGIGTLSPTQKLHVRGTDGATSLLVEEASVTAATRTLMTVSNNGQTRFVIHNTAAAVPAAGGYFFAQFDNGRFVIRPSGGGAGFFMDENGDITAEADLTVNGIFANPSSRTLKENFRPLDPQQVLARFVEVPITEWSYKGDEMRHVGPVTEDFHAAFGLGTKGTGIIPLDVQGVTMAAVQGLYQRLVALEAQRADLEAEVTELKALLAKTAE